MVTGTRPFIISAPSCLKKGFCDTCGMVKNEGSLMPGGGVTGSSRLAAIGRGTFIFTLLSLDCYSRKIMRSFLWLATRSPNSISAASSPKSIYGDVPMGFSNEWFYSLVDLCDLAACRMLK